MSNSDMIIFLLFIIY